MIDISKLNLNSMNREQVLEITKQELEEYKIARQQYNLSSNIPRAKALDKLNKRLGYFSFADSEVQAVRNEVTELLNEDVFKQSSKEHTMRAFNTREELLKAQLISK